MAAEKAAEVIPLERQTRPLMPESAAGVFVGRHPRLLAVTRR